MAFVLIGSDFHQSPLEELERLEKHSVEIREALARPSEVGIPTRSAAATGKTGAVVLSTCNRFEIYLDTDDFHSTVENTLLTVSSVSGVPLDECSKLLRVSYGDSVPQHLFAVTSGLESMVVGETDIAGQVKQALQESQQSPSTPAALTRLFERALETSKQVANSTGVAWAGRSIIGAALEIHQARHGLIRGKRVLVLGTGAYARVVVSALQRIDCQEIWVYSRTGRAQEFGAHRGTHAVPDGGLENELVAADLVVAASGNKTPSLNFHILQRAVERRSAELPIIDVTMSGSLTPATHQLSKVSVLGLEEIGRLAPAEHSESVLQAQELVRERVVEFVAQEVARQADPMIEALRNHVGTWVAAEVERVGRRAGEAVASEVERSLLRVTNALLHTPTVNAKSLVQQGSGHSYQAAVKALFNLDLSELPAND